MPGMPVRRARRYARMNPALENPATFNLLHGDHGISDGQMEHIHQELEKNAPSGFFIRKVSIPQHLGPVPNALYGPASGDEPVPEDHVHYMDRAGRGWMDRMVDLPFRPIDYVQVIGIRNGDDFKLFTIYGGPLAPMNPADPNNRDPEGSREWWSKHALSSQQWRSMK